MNIVGLLRVKNEARWIGEVLASITRLCTAIYVMDDHSTDATRDIARNCGAMVLPSPFNDFNEARDKDWLLSQVAALHEPGTWCLMIDGDEVLAPGCGLRIPPRLRLAGTVPAFALPIVYLWEDRNHIRVDGVYSQIRQHGRPSLFRLDPEAMTFATGMAGGNMHCSNVPARYVGSCAGIPAALLHLGYMERADRVRKYEWYNARDPHNPSEDGYRHMVIGDLFPPDSKFRHGGPLQVEALS